MKTKSIFTLLFSLVVFASSAQNIPSPTFEVTDSSVDLSIAIDAVIEDLDLSDVTTNILYDRGWKLGSLENFEGTLNSDTVNDHAEWLRQYGSLVTAYRGTPASSPVPSITTWKTQRNAAVASGKNPLVMMHIYYQRFLTDSVLLSTLIYENYGKLEDYPNQSTSPFEDVKAFSFSPYLSTVYDSLSLTFTTDPLFFKSNYGSSISSISVDFDNGSGYQTLSINGNIKVNWSTFGKKILKLKITYANAQTFYARSTLNLIQTLNYRIPGAKSDGYLDMPIVPIHHPTEPDYDAQLYIDLACGNDKLLKPYIFVEGFDPKEFGANQTYYNYYNDLITYQGANSSDYQLLTELSENGYDIVYVDFEQGSGDLIKNAETLGEVIKWVNAQKAINNSTEPNIVTGFSMGGLIARLGIRYLEIDNIDPEVSYYISWDAPHLGANVPLGIRLAVDDMYNITYGTELMGEYEEDLNDAYAVVNSPAALQMLLYSFDDFDWDTQTWDTSTRNYFANELYTKGLPTSTVQNIAIAKGNGIGAEQHFGSLDPLLNIDIQNNFDCFANLVDIYGLVEFDEDNGIGEQAVNQFIGSLIKALTFIGVRADVEMDVNAMPGYVPESYQIYERKIQFRILWIIPVGGAHTKVKVGYSYPYDSCPGSTYSVENFSVAGGDLEPLLDGTYAPCLELHEQDFCFIPTFSALDIYDYRIAPYTPIDPVSVVANNKTSFDKCFLLDPTFYYPDPAPTNETHISFSPSNIAPFSEYIVSPDFNAVNENPTVHGYTFNFGYAEVNNEVIKTTDRITHPLTISGLSSANGALWINRDARLGNKNDPAHPFCTSDDFTVALTRDCDYHYGRVTVESLGSIVIGESNNKTADVVVRNNAWIKMNDGFIEVRDGSKLIIEDGGELRLNGGLLRVQDGGEVIIKSGGKLIYEDGATIELNGNDAVLALGGLTRIGNDATFTFSYQGNESGYIRMLKEGFWGQRFSAGTNAEFRLQGENKDDLILYMEEDADLWEYQGAVPNDLNTSHRFDYVQFKDGKISMDHSARIVLLNDARFIRTKVEATDAQNLPRGIVTYTFCDISGSDLYKIDVEAKLYLTEPGTLYLTNSNFYGSAFAGGKITARGEGMRVAACLFEHTFIDIDQSTISNNVQRSVFQYNSGIVDTSPTELFIYQSEFDKNEYAVYKENGRVTARCSDFTDNDYAIVAAKLGEVNLSSLYNGGYNYFEYNDYNVELRLAKDLLMRDGYNQFYDGNILNVEGTLDNDVSCPYSINAYNNTWTPLSDTSVPYGDPNEPDQADFDVNITTGGGGNPVVCHIPFNFGPVASIASCGEFDDPSVPPKDEGPKSNSEIANLPLIYSPTYFDSIPFDLALRQAAATTTISDTLTGDDLLAADMYYELLQLAEMDSIPNDSIAGLIDQMKWRSLGNYKAIIERLFADSVITKEENQTIFNPTVENYVSVLMAFTDSIKTRANYKSQFGLEMMKATLFRTIGKKNQALHILENMNYCDQDSLQKLILEEQIQNVTFDLLAETFGADSYLIDSLTFELDSAIYQIPLENYVDTTGFGSYIQGPNSIYYSSCNDAFQQKSFGSSTAKNFKFNVYPNPTRTRLDVQILDNSVDVEEGFTFSLIDFTGKTMFTQRIVSLHSTMQLPKLASALYFYQIQSKGKVVEQGKISILN